MPRQHRALVVDDTDDSRELAVIVLERAGFAVTAAATGAEALRLADTAGADVIVLDVSLPDLDGFEVCQRLKADPTTQVIPVLFLSAVYTDLDAKVRGRDGCLVPVSMSVRRVVDGDGVVHEGILVDLTERKRAEEATALRSVADLANAAAHEINNPLTVIVGQLELIGRGLDIGGRIEQAGAAAARIRDIVSHMVQITHLEPSPDWPAGLPRMLDIRRSGAGSEGTERPS
jgi:CheY-like chemotaxis protein